MSLLSNPQVAKFCNEQLRPAMDRAAGFYLTANKILLAWQNQGLSTIIPNDATVIIDDGSSTDGRTQITGADVWTAIGGLQTYVTDIQANNGALLNNASKIAVNPQL